MQRNLDIDTISVFKVKVFIDLISNKEVGNYYREYYKKSGCEIPHIIHSDIKGILNDVLEKGFSGLVINRDPVQGEEIDGIRNLMLNIDPSHVLDLFGLIKKGASTIEFKGINENRVDVNERYIGVEMTKEYMDLFEVMRED
jgi:hypothetical protein